MRSLISHQKQLWLPAIEIQQKRQELYLLKTVPERIIKSKNPSSWKWLDLEITLVPIPNPFEKKCRTLSFNFHDFKSKVDSTRPQYNVYESFWQTYAESPYAGDFNAEWVFFKHNSRGQKVTGC